VRFVVQDPSHAAAYARFAERVGGAAGAMAFGYYGASEGVTIERRLLIDDQGSSPVVIGAVTTKLQDYVLAGERVRVAVATYPVSLGAVEPRYAMAGMLVFRKLLEAHPLNILLGMGPPDASPTARLSQMLGWQVSPVPYLFMPMRLGPLAAKQLAERPALAAAARAIGAFGLTAPIEWFMRAGVGRSDLATDQVAAFGADLDRWWAGYADEVGFSLVRDSRQMNAMFPGQVSAFRRFLFRRDGEVVGYAVLLVPPPEEAIRARGVNLVSVVEFCARQEALGAAAKSLARMLWGQRADAAIVNQSYGPALKALQSVGFRPRTTGTYLAASPQLQARLDAARIGLDRMVISLADGDGPIGLGVDL
jgi:hypothetical protein